MLSLLLLSAAAMDTLSTLTACTSMCGSTLVLVTVLEWDVSNSSGYVYAAVLISLGDEVVAITA